MWWCPDSAASLIASRSLFLTLVFNTEIVFRLGSTTRFGYKLTTVFSPLRQKGYGINGRPAYYNSTYVSQTLQLTLRRTTVYTQVNIGDYAFGMHPGGERTPRQRKKAEKFPALTIETKIIH